MGYGCDIRAELAITTCTRNTKTQLSMALLSKCIPEMASRHRLRHPRIQISKTVTNPAKLCKRESTKRFHNSEIKFPLVFRKVRPPTRKLKTTHKTFTPNLFM